MRTFGLIGKSLLHSYSQQYFTEKFHQNTINDAEYLLFSLENIHGVKELLKHPTLLGFNVTTPYKTDIIPFLEELDIVAQEVGAVNCVVKQNNKWVGYNTDVVGFEKLLGEVQDLQKSYDLTVLRSYCLTPIRSSALVLGSGGASKAVCYVLKQNKIPYQIVSRTKTEETITYNDITEKTIATHSLIINTTPLGMFPNINEMPPIPYPALYDYHILIDLIYNPEETMFLKNGKKKKALTINGLTMFNAQADANWELFFKIL